METMRGLGIVEWLRPLVQSNAWDFGVVWKFGDDPTRFIEWIGCCCRGGCSSGNNELLVKPKEEKGEEQCHLAPICRDTHFQHPVRTKACEVLTQLPFEISLYSGIHGEVVISQQPRWLTKDSTGTQVFIPIAGGLIELFTAKPIPKDINFIEFITAHCCVSLKQEATSAESYTYLNFNEHLLSSEYEPQSWPLTTLTSTSTLSVHLPASNQCSSHPSIEGPSSGSNPSSENPSFDSEFVCMTQHEHLKQSVKQSCILKRSKHNETSRKQQSGLSSLSRKGQEGKGKLVSEPQSEVYQAKNLVTERKRRNKIKTGLFTLRSLVPNITKMDRAAILGDAIDYIKELQKQEKELKDELRALEVEDSEKNTPQLRMPKGNKEQGGIRSIPLTGLNQSSSDCPRKTQMEVQAEVKHIGRTDFLIRLYCEQKQGGFKRLMEAIHSFGLQVADVNLNTFDGKVLNILTVQATKQDIDPTKLKEYLIEQTG